MTEEPLTETETDINKEQARLRLQREAVEVVEVSRTWECPECGDTVKWSYEDLVQSGTPVCGSCETDMDWTGQ